MFNEALGASFETPDVETIGGLVFDLLGRAPEAGDGVEVDERGLEVTGVDGARSEVIHVPAATADPDDGDTASGDEGEAADDEDGTLDDAER